MATPKWSLQNGHCFRLFLFQTWNWINGICGIHSSQLLRSSSNSTPSSGTVSGCEALPSSQLLAPRWWEMMCPECSPIVIFWWVDCCGYWKWYFSGSHSMEIRNVCFCFVFLAQKKNRSLRLVVWLLSFLPDRRLPKSSPQLAVTAKPRSSAATLACSTAGAVHISSMAV